MATISMPDQHIEPCLGCGLGDALQFSSGPKRSRVVCARCGYSSPSLPSESEALAVHNKLSRTINEAPITHARHKEMYDFIDTIARQGTRADLTPTRHTQPPGKSSKKVLKWIEETDLWWHEYIERIDSDLRSGAQYVLNNLPKFPSDEVE
jgi:hypothetical protein